MTHSSETTAPCTEGEYESLRQRWIDLISGRAQIIPALPVFQASLLALDDMCDAILADAEAPPWRVCPLVDRAVQDTADMTESFVRLQTLSKAWATPGSRFYQSAYVRNFVLRALTDLHRVVYHQGANRRGNWWDWEIGSSKALVNTLAVFREHIAPSDLAAYCAAIDYFVPDPWVQQGGTKSTGANRVDLCQTVIIRSILAEDDARLRHAVEGLAETWQHVERGDGFYRDGSFVQHSTIAYTGTYGVVLLEGLSLLMALLARSAYRVSELRRAALDEAVERSFAPFIWRGQMMDTVRGRAVSRESERGVDFGNDAIEAILRLARTTEMDRAARWQGLCKGWIEGARAGGAGQNILTDASIARTALVNDLMTSEVAPQKDLQESRIFPSMDRLVHRSPNGDWALAVAMNSRRIAWYECGNGENNLGVRTSSGMHYLYVDGDEGHFDDLFWPTSDLAAPPGTTVDLVPLPPKAEGEWGATCPQNEWTGGVVLDRWSLAGQHMVAPGGSGLTARKTWFAAPSFVVCLVSDVGYGGESLPQELRVDPDAKAGRSAKTVIEHRSTGAATGVLLFDGEQISGSRELSTPRWAHLKGVAGYVFLSPSNVRAAVSERAGSWQQIDTNGSTTLHSRNYATIEVHHVEKAASLAYLLLPLASAKETESIAEAPPVEVIANDPEVQAVVCGDVTAVNFWRAGCAVGVAADRPASVIIERSPRALHVSVADPTQAEGMIVLDFVDESVTAVEGQRVTLSQKEIGARVAIDVSGCAGTAVAFQLLRE